MMNEAGIGFSVAALGIAWGSLRRIALERQLTALRDAVAQLGLAAEPGRPLRLTHPRVQALWMMFRAVADRGRWSGRDGWNAFVDLAARIPTLGHGSGAPPGEQEQAIDEIAKQIAGVLHDIGGAEIRASAIFLVDGEGVPARVASLRGIPEARVRSVLLHEVERRRHGRAEHDAWGYRIPISGSALDFEMFQVGLQLFLPLLRRSGGVGSDGVDREWVFEGALWLGLSPSAFALSAEQRRQVEAVAEFAASLLGAARRLRERIDAREQARSLVLGMSHDLRTPGASALYTVHDLLTSADSAHECLTTRQRARLELIRTCLEDQMGMISTLLESAKCGPEMLRAVPTRFDLEGELRAAIDGIQSSVERQGLECQWSIEAGPVEILWDRGHFRRILENLLTNAVKYTDHGTVRLECELRGRDVWCHVSDTGIGVPEAERYLLFSEFRRCSNIGGRPGTGVGLAGALRLARVNGGEIHYSPGQVEGSVFSLEMRDCVCQGPVLPSDLDSVSESVDESPGLILIVDDDEGSCRMISRFLDTLGRPIRHAHSLRSAREIVETEDVRTVITDLYLGDGTATELIRAVAARNASAQVVIMTGADESVVEKDLHEIASVRILSKPVLRDSIVSILLA